MTSPGSPRTLLNGFKSIVIDSRSLSSDAIEGEEREILNEEMLCSDFGRRLSLKFVNQTNGDWADDGNGLSLRRKRHSNSVHFDEDQDSMRAEDSTSTSDISYNYAPPAPPTMTWNDDTIDAHVPRRTGYRIAFEIISAKTASSTGRNAKKYISYTILVKRTPGLEIQPGILERRYSDFLNLHTHLRKNFPDLMNDLPFPKKTLVGNFDPEVITQRSVAFQHLLAYCLSVSECRSSVPFREFLYSSELKDAIRLMKCSEFDNASNMLENIYFVMDKLCLPTDPLLFHTLCALIASLNGSENIEEAQAYSAHAYELISSAEHDNDERTIPLLILSTRLYWLTGQDKRPLESKLVDLESTTTRSQKKQLSLLELVIGRGAPKVTSH